MDITKEIIKEIAYIETLVDIEQNECFLIETFLTELFYYSQKEDKIINIDKTVESFAQITSVFLQILIDRNTDVWDSIFILENDTKENKLYFEKHSFLYSELNGRKRDKKDIKNLYSKTLIKIQTYLENKKVTND